MTLLSMLQEAKKKSCEDQAKCKTSKNEQNKTKMEKFHY